MYEDIFNIILIVIGFIVGRYTYDVESSCVPIPKQNLNELNSD